MSLEKKFNRKSSATRPLSDEAFAFTGAIFIPLLRKINDDAMSGEPAGLQSDPRLQQLEEMHKQHVELDVAHQARGGQHDDEYMIPIRLLDRQIMKTVLRIAQSHYSRDVIAALVPASSVTPAILKELATFKELSGYLGLAHTANKLPVRLTKLDEGTFFDKMIRDFPADAGTGRMQAAIGVMQKRFPKLSKADQLALALDTAVEKDNIKMIDFLLEQGALIDGTKQGYMPGLLGQARSNPVSTAIRHSTKETLQHLFLKGADPNPKGNSFLYSASYGQGNDEKTRVLLDAGAKGGASSAVYGLLFITHNFPLAQEILDKTGFDVNHNNGEIIRSAVLGLERKEEGAEEAIAILRSAGADFAAVANRRDKEAGWYGRTDDPSARLARSLAAAKPKASLAP